MLWLLLFSLYVLYQLLFGLLWWVEARHYGEKLTFTAAQIRGLYKLWHPMDQFLQVQIAPWVNIFARPSYRWGRDHDHTISYLLAKNMQGGYGRRWANIISAFWVRLLERLDKGHMAKSIRAEEKDKK